MFKDARARIEATRPFLSGLALLAATTAVAAAAPLTARDLVTLARVSDPQASPDGQRIAYVVRETDMEADRGRTDLWSVPTAGGPPRQLTTHEANDSAPRWSPDGRHLYFLSSRSGSSQVWRLPVDGGEAQPVSTLPVDVGMFVVSPAGDRLVVSLEVFRDCDDLACTAVRLEDDASSSVTAQHYDSLFMRHWDSWKDGRRAALFALVLDESGTAQEPVPLTGALDADVPVKPFGGAEDIAVTPDGRHVYFAARNPDGKEAWSGNVDIYRARADGTGRPENMTPDNPAWDGQPAVSPDGRTVAWLAMARPGFEADRIRLVSHHLRTGRQRVVTEGWDRSIAAYAFAADGASFYATAQHVGHRPLWHIDPDRGDRPALIAAEGHVGGFTVAGEQIVFAHDDLATPAELYRTSAAGGTPARLTAANAEALAAIDMGTYEQFEFPGWNDETVHGFVVRPAGFEPDGRYPVAFLIHGGPQGSFSNHFHYRWNPQTYAGAGYAVVMIDFHGSTGYGQAFTDSISGDWGGKPLTDLQLGLAAALERYPWLDGERVCALGASYGGYMINWIAGVWPERFRCLVNHDGVFDNRMMYYATEELWFPEWEHGGPHYANPAGYEKHNPVAHVDQWKDPMLVIHGALDYRVPDTQGIAAFTALQRRGIASEFLYFPDENHWVLKPHNSIRWHETVLDWLGRWLEPTD